LGLKVVETWKGEPTERAVVRYMPSLGCPAPAHYEVGEHVVAFLFKDDEGGWRTRGMSYGSLYPHFDELETLEGAVRAVASEDKRSWHVARSADPVTRWHGLYELVPNIDGRHHYYDRTDREQYPLSGDEQRIIAEGFVARPKLDVTFAMTLAALRGYDSRAVDRLAVAGIDELLTWEYPPSWATAALLETLIRHGVEPPPPKAPPKDDDPIFWAREETDRATELTRIWIGNRLDLVAAETPKFVRRRPRVRSVGQDTPL